MGLSTRVVQSGHCLCEAVPGKKGGEAIRIFEGRGVPDRFALMLQGAWSRGKGVAKL